MEEYYYKLRVFHGMWKIKSKNNYLKRQTVN